MLPKTRQEAIMHIEESLKALRSHFGSEDTEDEPEIEEKMVGRGRKRRPSFGFKKKDNEAEGDDSSH